MSRPAEDDLADIARRLYEAEQTRTPIRQLSLEHPDMTIEDAYAVQRALVALKVADGREVKGRKIELTSKVMQRAVSIDEPDYGALFDDMFIEDGGRIPLGRYIRPRVEVELAFVLGEQVSGPGVTLFDVLRATEFVTPALEILDARVQMSDPETGHLRTIVDTIADNASDAGLVLGGRVFRPLDVDLRWVAALLLRNGTIEESGVAAAVLNHPGNGVAWLANRLSPPRGFLKRCGGGPCRIVHQTGFRRAGGQLCRRLRSAGHSVGDVRFGGVVTNRWTQRISDGDPRIGMWVASGSGYVTEICAGSGIDWLLLDPEHGPNDLRPTLEQLQVLAGYPDVDVLVRPPSADPVFIKQLLDIGAQNIIVPMIDGPGEAVAAGARTRYPPLGIRGVGSALARASRWNRISDYLVPADATVSLTVQVESVAGLALLGEIADVDGVDAVFIGPADLAASMGKLGQPAHPEVVSAIEAALATIVNHGKRAGVNAFSEPLARRYMTAGASFVLVGADVALLARGAEELAARYRGR